MAFLRGFFYNFKEVSKMGQGAEDSVMIFENSLIWAKSAICRAHCRP